MRSLVLAMTTCLATSLWAQLPFSFSGTAGDACIPAQDPYIQPWPGVAGPDGSVRFAWSVTNTEASPVQLLVQVVRDSYSVPPSTFIPAITVHSFTVTAAPNATTNGEAFWTCAPLSFEQGRAHSVRISGPAGSCTAFNLAVEESLGVFQDDPEPNNSSGQFTVLAAGVYQEGRMNRNSVSDQDWYRLQLPENGTLRIEFEGEQPSATTTFDMQFQLSFTTGTVISTNAVPIGANRVPVSSVIEIPCRGSGGVYNLRLTNGGACDISYRFRYVVVAPVFGNDPEPNNGIGQAVLVGYDTQRVGQLNHDFDGNIDVYRIDPPLNGVLSIDVDAEHSGASPANVQVVLQNSAGTVLATWNPQAGANGNVIASELNYDCLGNTVFYYLSFSSSACGTSYRWKYTVDQPVFGNDVEPNQSTSQAILLPLATASEGQINFFAGFNDNTDFYRIDMPGNGILNLTVEAEHAGASTSESLEARMTLSTGGVLATWNAPVGAGSQAASTTFQLLCQSALQPVYLRMQSSVCGTSYRVSWTYTPSVFANDVETNNGTGSAIVLPVGTAGEGGLNFQGADNVDFYRMDMPGNGILSLTVEAEHAGTSTTENLEARISISSGTVITTWNAPVGASSQPTSTTFTLPCQSTVWPLFLRLQSSVCGTSYRVSWTYSAPVYANDLEPNNSVGSGTDIDLNAAAQDGQIGFGATTDADVYHFTHPGGPWSVSVNAEHSGAGSGTMTLELYNSFTLLQTYTVNVGGSSTPQLNTFSLPSLDAGTLYRLRFAPVTCGVSYRILCYDDDNDGTCNAFDLCAGGPEPGTPCDDLDDCTANDVIQADCSCAGTAIPDTDNDGTCDAIDGCPNDPDKIAAGTCGCGNPEPGTACDDGNVNTGDDTINGDCLCVGIPIDCNGEIGGNAFIDNCGTCVGGNTGEVACAADCNGDFGGSAFIDNCGTCVGGNTGEVACVADCNGDFGGSAFIDNCGTCVGGSTGEVACVQDCEGVFGGTALPGSPCDDQNASTINDTWSAGCMCQGTPVSGTSTVVLELRTNNTYDQVTWEILASNNSVVCGGGPYSALINTPITESCQLANDCYRLRVFDSGGDGFGIGGGYQLRLPGSYPQGTPLASNVLRIIDNFGNFTSGSLSALGGGPNAFCLPMSTQAPIFASRDKLDWVAGRYIVAEEDGAVSGQWQTGDQTDDGYEFWFFDPNGSYSFRRFRNHATADGFANVGATRACHARINGWLAGNHIPANRLMNVRIRTRVNGVNGNWGPAFRFMIDPVAAACPQTKLLDDPNNQYVSCNQTRNWGNNNFIHARPVSGANRYQFRFRIADENFNRVITSNNYFVQLNWATQPLVAGKTYDVDVRVSKDGGATWCVSGLSWGENCKLSIAAAPAQGGGGNLAMPATEGGLSLWPNPNNGELLTVSLSGIAEGVNTVAVDIFDLTGKRVVSREVAVTDGPSSTSLGEGQHGGKLYTVLELNGELATGVYLVSLTAGSERYTQRLVVGR